MKVGLGCWIVWTFSTTLTYSLDNKSIFPFKKDPPDAHQICHTENNRKSVFYRNVQCKNITESIALTYRGDGPRIITTENVVSALQEEKSNRTVNPSDGLIQAAKAVAMGVNITSLEVAGLKDCPKSEELRSVYRKFNNEEDELKEKRTNSVCGFRERKSFTDGINDRFHYLFRDKRSFLHGRNAQPVSFRTPKYESLNSSICTRMFQAPDFLDAKSVCLYSHPDTIISFKNDSLLNPKLESLVDQSVNSIEPHQNNLLNEIDPNGILKIQSRSLFGHRHKGPVDQTQAPDNFQSDGTMEPQTDYTWNYQTDSSMYSQTDSSMYSQTDSSAYYQADSNVYSQQVSLMDYQTVASMDYQTAASIDYQTVESIDYQTVASFDSQTVGSIESQTVAGSMDFQTVGSMDYQTVGESIDSQTVACMDSQTNYNVYSQTIGSMASQTDYDIYSQTVAQTDYRMDSQSDSFFNSQIYSTMNSQAFSCLNPQTGLPIDYQTDYSMNVQTESSVNYQTDYMNMQTDFTQDPQTYSSVDFQTDSSVDSQSVASMSSQTTDSLDPSTEPFGELPDDDSFYDDPELGFSSTPKPADSSSSQSYVSAIYESNNPPGLQPDQSVCAHTRSPISSQLHASVVCQGGTSCDRKSGCLQEFQLNGFTSTLSNKFTNLHLKTVASKRKNKHKFTETLWLDESELDGDHDKPPKEEVGDHIYLYHNKTESSKLRNHLRRIPFISRYFNFWKRDKREEGPVNLETTTFGYDVINSVTKYINLTSSTELVEYVSGKTIDVNIPEISGNLNELNSSKSSADILSVKKSKNITNEEAECETMPCHPMGCGPLHPHSPIVFPNDTKMEKEYEIALTGKLADRVVVAIFSKVNKNAALRRQLGLCNQGNASEVAARLPHPPQKEVVDEASGDSLKQNVLKEISISIDKLIAAKGVDANCLKLPPEMMAFLHWLLTESPTMQLPQAPADMIYSRRFKKSLFRPGSGFFDVADERLYERGKMDHLTHFDDYGFTDRPWSSAVRRGRLTRTSTQQDDLCTWSPSSVNTKRSRSRSRSSVWDNVNN